MTQAAINTDQAIVNLLAAAKRRRRVTPAESASDYDWNSPCALTPPQRLAIKEFAATATADVSAALGRALGQPMELIPGEVSERYAGQLASEEGWYYVSLAAGDCCGYVAMMKATARQWVASVLGDTSGGGEERELSALETSLLMDVIATSVEAFSQALQKAGGKPLQCERQLNEAIPSLDGGEQSVCLLLPMGAEGQESPTLLLAVKSETLSAAAGSAEAGNTRTPQQMRADVQAAIEQADIGGEVWIAATQLTMRDVMDLAEGDVLLLEAGLGDPVELTSAGKTVAWGYLAQSQGRYAMKVAGRCDEN